MSSSQFVAASPAYCVVPDRTTPKVLGILNIVFGCLALPCGIYFTLYFAMISFVMPVMMDEANKSQKRIIEERQAAQATELPVLSDDTRAKVADDNNTPNKNAAKPISQPQESPGGTIADAAKAAKDESGIGIDGEDMSIEVDLDVEAPAGPGMVAGPPDIFGGLAKNGDTRVIVWASSDAIATLLLNLGMIVAGIGLLMRHGWGRTMAIWVATFKIVTIIASQAYWAMVCVPSAAAKFGEAISSMPNSGPSPDASAMSFGFTAYMTVIAVITVVFCSIYPIICLLLLRMTRVKAAFTEESATINQMVGGHTMTPQ